MNEFQNKLKEKMNEYAHGVYRITKSFPREEVYGVTSQLRRSALSVILNYIEGFARQKYAVRKNFWEISYGSLKESSYLLQFSLEEKFCEQKDYEQLSQISDEIGAMLWKSLQSLKE
jgi:four helix bundle protein